MVNLRTGTVNILTEKCGSGILLVFLGCRYTMLHT